SMRAQVCLLVLGAVMGTGGNSYGDIYPPFTARRIVALHGREYAVVRLDEDKREEGKDGRKGGRAKGPRRAAETYGPVRITIAQRGPGSRPVVPAVES